MTDSKTGLKQYKRPDGSTYFRLPGGDDDKVQKGMPRRIREKSTVEEMTQKGMPRRIRKKPTTSHKG